MTTGDPTTETPVLIEMYSRTYLRPFQNRSLSRMNGLNPDTWWVRSEDEDDNEYLDRASDKVLAAFGMTAEETK